MELTEVAPGLLAPDSGKHLPKNHTAKACTLFHYIHCSGRIYTENNLRGAGSGK